MEHTIKHFTVHCPEFTDMLIGNISSSWLKLYSGEHHTSVKTYFFVANWSHRSIISGMQGCFIKNLCIFFYLMYRNCWAFKSNWTLNPPSNSSRNKVNLYHKIKQVCFIWTGQHLLICVLEESISHWKCRTTVFLNFREKHNIKKNIWITAIMQPQLKVIVWTIYHLKQKLVWKNSDIWFTYCHDTMCHKGAKL